jgi:hypothetical protein
MTDHGIDDDSGYKCLVHVLYLYLVEKSLASIRR